MGELEQQYGEQVRFTIVSSADTAQRQDEIDEYGFTDLKHGLVIFDAEGEAVVTIPGHRFGKEEIEAGMKDSLPGL